MTWLERLCRARGLRVTEHRRIVLKVLSTAIDHPGALEIHRRAAANHLISRATVYRILNSLVDAGVVKRYSLDGSEACYEPVSKDQHDHLIDVRTGEIVELEGAALADRIRKVAHDLGYDLVNYQLKMLAERVVPVRSRATDRNPMSARSKRPS